MKSLAIGRDDFKHIIENDSYYIDKTKFIEEILKDTSMVKLITRSRRFGKALNMSTLKYFFDIEKKKKIWNYLITYNLAFNVSLKDYKRNYNIQGFLKRKVYRNTQSFKVANIGIVGIINNFSNQKGLKIIMKTYIITGAAGFIGAKFLKYILKKYKDINVIIVDVLTYAGNLGTIKEELKDSRVKFEKVDIRDRKEIEVV